MSLLADHGSSFRAIEELRAGRQAPPPPQGDSCYIGVRPVTAAAGEAWRPSPGRQTIWHPLQTTRTERTSRASYVATRAIY